MASLRILIVDDHAAVRRGLRSFLSVRRDWQVVGEAADGREAIERAKELRPDIILMDVSMPHLSGLEASKVIRRELPETKIIMVSQNDPSIVRNQAADVGAFGYVAKTDLARDLVPAIDRAAPVRNGASIASSDGTAETNPRITPPAGAAASANLSPAVTNAWEQAAIALSAGENRFREMIDALPMAIYTTDAEGHLTYFNAAAVEFSGHTPELGSDQWCVSWKLFWPDGTRMRHSECPMAVALREGRIIEGAEAIAERPDGTQRWFTPYPKPLRDSTGKIIGGINVLMDITARKQAERASTLLAGIVDSSDDAIVSKNLDGFVTSWNKGAERIFGYTSAEIVGRHITTIIPRERYDEETDILRRLRKGERIDHFETVRMRKDGMPLNVSLTISPVKDSTGRIVGASKIARDVTDRKRAEKTLADHARQQEALFALADQLHRAQTLEEIYSTGLDTVFRALQCDRAAILLSDEHGVMRFVSSRGLSDEYRKAVEGHSPWSSDVSDPMPLGIHCVDASDLSEDLKRVVRKEDIAAMEFIPLVCGGKLMGKFMVYFNKAHEFSEAEIELGLIIARQIAFGIERKRSEEALKASEEGLRRLSATLDAEVRARTIELEQRNAELLWRSEQLRDLSRRMAQMQDNERRHIARELHDSAGQTLTVLGMSLAALAQNVRPELKKEAEAAEELVHQLSREIRTTSYLLHPPLLDENGLSAALSWYVKGLIERSNLDIQLNIPEDFGRLAPEIELVIFRLVQESLTNIHRHSGSKNAVIRVERRGESAVLEIEDKGKGISAERLAAIQSRGAGVGIRGMGERVRQYKGEMNIETNGSGTKLSFMLPVGESEVLRSLEMAN